MGVQAFPPNVLKRYQELAQLEIAAKRKGVKAGASNFQDTVVRYVYDFPCAYIAAMWWLQLRLRRPVLLAPQSNGHAHWQNHHEVR